MKPMNFLFKAFSACVLLATTSLATAASITYYVERFIPKTQVSYTEASINGSITTNGKLGLLDVSDILAYRFSLQFGDKTLILDSQVVDRFTSTPLYAGGIVADPTTLSIVASLTARNYGGFIIQSYSGYYGIALEDPALLPDGFSGETAFTNPIDYRSEHLFPYSSKYTFASTTTSAVPLPSSLALVAPLVLFALRRHRRV
jgi:hypothetical protein